MSLSPPVSRQLRHRRAILAEAFERDGGLRDLEACLTDHKPRDVALAPGVRPKGLPIHELWLRITIDRKLTIVDDEASSERVPYPGHCKAANPAYRALIGLNHLNDFRRQARRLLAGTAGSARISPNTVPSCRAPRFRLTPARDGARATAPRTSSRSRSSIQLSD